MCICLCVNEFFICVCACKIMRVHVHTYNVCMCIGYVCNIMLSISCIVCTILQASGQAEYVSDTIMPNALAAAFVLSIVVSCTFGVFSSICNVYSMCVCVCVLAFVLSTVVCMLYILWLHPYVMCIVCVCVCVCVLAHIMCLYAHT